MSVTTVQAKLLEKSLFRLSVEQYEGIIDCGLLTADDAVELIDGVLVQKLPKNPPHTTALLLAVEALKALVPAGYCVRSESAIRLDSSEPEPDVIVARGSLRDYARRHPVPSEVALVVEVSGATLTWDRTTKLAVYAAAGLGQYWIVNLQSREVEVYSDPEPTTATYLNVKTCKVGQQVSLDIGGVVMSVSVDSLLP